MAVAAVTLAVIPACSDDNDEFDGPGTVIQAPAQSSVSVTAEILSATVTWGAVENASQYGVILYDSEGSAVQAIATKETSATFEDLNPSTDYSVGISSYGTFDGVLENVPVTKLDFRTEDAIQLDTPAISGHKKQGTGYRVAWKAISGADSYEYICTNTTLGEIYTGNVKTSSVTMTGLTSGDYEFKVKAISGAPEYLDSEWSATIEFKF